ncbi:hypothetical protein NM208_g182 [Fusarium decemcellulare]|uniref:Uncharacterized protein n=1 Tax=Fusarium decemcellulare TaxID=57161 RepID=A0ACC1T0K0_9HYPO|nr:hypothetical protein NM208_g182 [Fusarium decemcellulare]
MPPRPKEKPENRFIFVGGPALTDRAGPVRTRLLQQAHRQKKTQQRQNATLERELLTKGERNPVCTCSQDATTLAAQIPEQSQNVRHRPIMPKMPAPTGIVQVCPSCGKIPAPPSQVSAMQVWDIGAGSSNPMIPVDDTISQLKVQELLHFACTAIWPNFRPLGYTSNCYRSWVFPFDNKVRLYALLWSASYHRDILNLTYGGPNYLGGSKEQLILKGLALESLRNEVDTYTGATPIDSIIMCILYLAVNDTVGTRLPVYRESSPFNPPFRSLHALDLYGSRDYHPVHWKIIQDLLGRYGGVEVLHEFGLAWLLSLSDIMGAAHTLQKPLYPCMGVYGKRLFLEPPLVLFESCAPHFAGHTAGSGFDELLSIDPPVRQEVVATFSHIGQLSCVLQYYTVESYSLEILDLLGDCRNYVHYHLFSSPDANSTTEEILQHTDQDPEVNELSKEIYLACRLALHLYATHVTFPIPRSTIVRRQLLQLLRPKLQFLAEKSIGRSLLLWCVSVALVASDIDSDEPMLAIFKRLCQELKVDSLDDLLALLRKFAWVDKAAERQYTRLSDIINE